MVWLTGFSLLWLAWAILIQWVIAPGFRGHDVLANFIIRGVRCYARLLHGLQVHGTEHVPRRTPEGIGKRPLIIVANHTAGIDPMLIQAALPFEVRWVMADDMRVDRLEWAWAYTRVIFVDRQGGEGGSGLREALRHLKGRATLGVFPEGMIERPARRLYPFQPGIGLLVSRSKALVLPVVVEGTPQVDPAWASFSRPSRSSVRFLPPIDCQAEGWDAAEIGPNLRRVFVEATGWSMNDRPPKFEDGQWWYFNEKGERLEAHLFENRT